jgi:hypothetical protein
MRRQPRAPYSASEPKLLASSERAISGLIDGCERAVFQHRIEEIHKRRIVDLTTKLIACAGYAGEDLIHADPGLRDHMQRCLADIEDRLALALKQYRKIFSHVGVELNAAPAVSAERIDFNEINRRALAQLPELLRVWLPGGKQHGAEYVVCNPKRHDLTPGSFKINTQTGKWSDFIPGGAYGSDPISLYAFLYNLSDDKEGQCEAARQLGQRVGVEVANGNHYDFNSASKPTPVVPVAEDAPPCKWRHSQYGEPVAKWAYRDADGRLLGYAARVEYIEDGERKKDILPVTWCRIDHATGHYHAWRARDIPTPRPLYRLPYLRTLDQ